MGNATATAAANANAKLKPKVTRLLQNGYAKQSEMSKGNSDEEWELWTALNRHWEQDVLRGKG